jgi:large subunit ribosomal protein L22
MADKDDQQSPGSKGPKADEAKVEAEATEAKAEAAEEKPAEEKPKPKRRSRARKPAAKKAAAEDTEKAKEKAAEEEAESEAAEAEGEPEPEDAEAKPKPASRRRRGGEVAAGSKQKPRRTPRRAAAGEPAPDITVRARAKYVRTAPRKARLVIDHIRGKDVDQARAILTHTPRAASRDVLKLLDSAIANAENNHDLVADDLMIGRAYVDEGPTLKRYRPRALGRATRIRKRTSHMTIELVSKE